MFLAHIKPGLLTLFGLLAISAGTVEGASRKPFGGKLEMPLHESITSTDPIRVIGEQEWMLARQVHETLYRLDADGRILPALAQDLPKVSSDGSELLVTIRPGLTFHDGRPITTSEVIASLHRLLSPKSASPHWWLLAPIRGAVAFHQGKRTRVNGLERVNNLTFRIRLEMPNPGFLSALSAVPASIVSIKVTKEGGESERHPAGAGPFRLAWTKDEKEIELQAFDSHWRGRPYLDGVSLRPFESARDLMLAFELKRIHIGNRVPRRSGGHVQIIDGVQNHQVFLVSNTERLNKYPDGFRLALMQAIDRKALAEYLVGKQGHATDELLALGDGAPSGRRFMTNPKAARKYFKALAVERMGLPAMLQFIVRADRPEDKAAAERIQVNLVDVGVSVFVVPLERPEYDARLREGRFDFYLSRPLPLARSAELQLLGRFAHIEGAQAVADLLAEFQQLPQDASRDGIIRERARGYQARVNWFPLFVHKRFVVAHLNVRGLRFGAEGVCDLAEVWLAK